MKIKKIILSLFVLSSFFFTNNVNAATTDPVPLPPVADCNKASDPSVTILAPNGGEKYEAGQQVKVQWSTCNVYVDTVVKINLLPITYQGNVIPVPTPNIFSYNTGAVVFTLPSQSTFPPLVYGNYYKFHIDFPSLALDGDDSDNFFSINNVGSVDSPVDISPLPPVSWDSGCTSTTDFNPKTGEKCPPMPTPLPPVSSDPGCALYTKYSFTTGNPCPVTYPPVISGAPAGTSVSGNAVSLGSRILRFGLKGSDVEEVQKKLLKKGVYLGPVTGYFGSITEQGVKDFQIKNNLTSDGIVGPETLKILDK